MTRRIDKLPSAPKFTKFDIVYSRNLHGYVPYGVGCRGERCWIGGRAYHTVDEAREYIERSWLPVQPSDEVHSYELVNGKLVEVVKAV